MAVVAEAVAAAEAAEAAVVAEAAVAEVPMPMLAAPAADTNSRLVV